MTLKDSTSGSTEIDIPFLAPQAPPNSQQTETKTMLNSIITLFKKYRERRPR